MPNAVNEMELIDAEDTQKDKYLTFSLGDEYYGIEIGYVTEIIGIQPIAEVPELPDYIRGIINLRGKIIPVMDVRRRFRKDAKEYDDRTCIIVIDVMNTYVGLIVDRVSEVLSIEEKDIELPPNMSKGSVGHIKGIGKVGSDVKLILDCNRLLNQEDLENIKGE